VRKSSVFSLSVLLLICITGICIAGSAVHAADPAEKNPHLDRARREAAEFDEEYIRQKMKESDRAFEEAGEFADPKTRNPHFAEAYEEAEEVLSDVAERYGIKFRRLPRMSLKESENGKGQSKGKGKEKGKTFYVPVSRSVDPEFIRNVYFDSKKENVNLVFLLRGFIGNEPLLRPTVAWWFRIHADEALKDHRIPALDIDPLFFRRVDPRAVPALYDPETDCIVYGDASLRALIEAVSKRRCNETLGKTSEIEEEDALEVIEAAVASSENVLAEKLARARSHLVSRYENLHCVDLPGTEDTKTYRVTPRYTLPFEIPDPTTGRTLYPAGFAVNPLEFGSPGGSILMVDFGDPLQRRTFPILAGELPKPVRVFAVAGDLRGVGETELPEGVVLYANCFAVRRIIEYGACRALPCAVVFDPPELLVREFGRKHLRTLAGETETPSNSSGGKK